MPRYKGRTELKCDYCGKDVHLAGVSPGDYFEDGRWVMIDAHTWTSKLACDDCASREDKKRA